MNKKKTPGNGFGKNKNKGTLEHELKKEAEKKEGRIQEKNNLTEKKLEVIDSKKSNNFIFCLKVLIIFSSLISYVFMISKE